MRNRITIDQAVKLTDFVTSVRPEWSASNLLRILQNHAYGFKGFQQISAEKSSELLVIAAFDQSQGEPAQLAA
jgi:hypothetical protein